MDSDILVLGKGENGGVFWLVALSHGECQKRAPLPFANGDAGALINERHVFLITWVH